MIHNRTLQTFEKNLNLACWSPRGLGRSNLKYKKRDEKISLYCPLFSIDCGAQVGELIIRETAVVSLPTGVGVWEAGQLIYK